MKTVRILFILLAAAAACSCNVQKRIVYLQDAQNEVYKTIGQNSQIRIKPLDRLTIVISSKDPELAAPFNAASSYNSLNPNPNGNMSNSALQVRTVSPEGMLDMPILGQIECKDLTRHQLADKIAAKIREAGYFDDPTVNVQFSDMKISVLGEVARPGVYSIVQDKLTLLEALALAGDMTIYGERDRVSVIRETEDGGHSVEFLDLTSKDLFASPSFYLRQNDVVYVRPNKYKAATAEINQNRTFWLSIVGTLVSISTLVITITQLSK